MNTIINYVPLMACGIGATLGSWIAASILGCFIGVVLGIVSSKNIGSKRTVRLIRIYTFVTKGIPAYVQILIAYFLLPAAFGIPISGFIAATGALAICSSGYITEIVRSGINAIPQGQWDACTVLGYPLRQSIYRIIGPQAAKTIISPLIGEFEQLLKSTSLLATIGVTEITRVGMNIISRELNPIPVYIAIALVYLTLSAILNIIMVYSERSRYGYR